MLGALPEGLRADFEAARAQRRAIGLLPTKRPTSILGAADRRRLQEQRDPRDYWAAFFRLFPGSPGVIELSRVGFSRDEQWALVLVEYGCGALCGGTLYVLVQRVGARWHVVRKAQPRVA
jgi:hypothetical protein